MSNIHRNLNSLRGLTAELLLTSDWSLGRLKDYFRAFEEQFDHDTSFGVQGLPPASCEIDSVPEVPTTPGEGPEAIYGVPCRVGQVIHDVFCQLDVILFFFKTPIIAEEFSYMGPGEYHSEDLRIQLTNPCWLTRAMAGLWQELKIHAEYPRNVGLVYDLRGGELRRLDFQARHDDFQSIFHGWWSNSKIISLHDLLGAQLIIQIVDKTIVLDEIKELRESVWLRRLVLKLPNGIYMRLDKNNVVRRRSRYSFEFYSVRFPDNLDDLLAMTSYEEVALLK
jgi:hypothetical protein